LHPVVYGVGKVPEEGGFVQHFTGDGQFEGFGK
jgi:hypothetical protein